LSALTEGPDDEPDLNHQTSPEAPATVELHRAADASETLLWSGSLPAGRHTLPAGYTLDATDRGLTRFTVRAVTASGTLDRSVLVRSEMGR